MINLENKLTSTYQNQKSEINIEEKISSQLPGWQERLARIMSEFGDEPIGEITVSSVYGGMRGLFALVLSLIHI